MSDEPQISSEELQDRHSSPEEMTDDDLPALLGLMGVVGAELNQIDKFSIDKKARALQLTNETIQRARKKQPDEPPVQNVPVQKEPVQQNEQSPVQNKKQPAKQPKAQPSVISDDVLKAIQQVEKKVDKLYNTYDKLLTKICSKTKRITFTIANDTDK